jgi:multidrug efflux pump subunit AcrA (membrane-fusion protein)
MFAEAHVSVAEHANALVVPPSAIVRNTEGAAVYVVTGDTAERKSVQVGLEKLDAVEILSGVTEGQTVLTSSVYGLGEKAKLAKPDEAGDKEKEREKDEKGVKDEKAEKPAKGPAKKP